MDDKYKLEPLGNGIVIAVSETHKFSTDTILLAHFASPKKYEIAAELGTGCGAIPLIWSRDNVPKHTLAVDIQKQACDLLSESIKLNNLQDKIEVKNINMLELNSGDYAGKFDLVVCNPPYKEEGSGITNDDEGKRIARHESSVTLEQIASIASKMLRFSGRFCLCQRIQRLCDVTEAFRKAGIEPKRLRLVQQRPNKAPKFFLIEGKRGGLKGGLICEPTLIIEDEKGDFSEEMKEIYGVYKSYKYDK